MEVDLADLSPAALLAHVAAGVRRRRLAEVEELCCALAWADLHGDDTATDLVDLGGEGTPLVSDGCLGEFALARGTGVMAAVNAISDGLDLRHRLPRMWEAMQSGEVDVWIPRRVAKLSRHLPAAVVRVVDAAVAPMLGHEAAGRILEVAEAKVIEADPALHQQRVDAAHKGRYVTTGRSDQRGLRTLIARIDAGDAVWVEATVARVAGILAPQHPELTADEVRAVAFGYLARPGELLALLLEHLEPGDELLTQTTVDADEPDVPPDPAEQEPALNRALAVPADLVDVLKAFDWTRLTPKVVLYVHLHEAVLTGTPGVARVEDLGPHAVTQLKQLLPAGARISVKPVIDLNDRVRTTAYEHPERVKEMVHLVTGGDYWPWATSTHRNVDHDHVTPYDPGGPPGQTGTHNSGPLGRRHHRWKTHTGFQARQAGTGRYIWKTPHGLAFQVDHTGTRPIPAEHAETIINAPPGVDVYVGPPLEVADPNDWSRPRAG